MERVLRTKYDHHVVGDHIVSVSAQRALIVVVSPVPALADRVRQAGDRRLSLSVVRRFTLTDRLETRPRVGRGAVGEVHDHDVTRSATRDRARIALDDGDMPRVRGRARRPRGSASPRTTTAPSGYRGPGPPIGAPYQPLPDGSSEPSAAISVPPPSQSASHTLWSGGPTSLASLDDRFTMNSRRQASRGRRTRGATPLGAGHRACRPIEGVRPRIGGEDQQPLAVGGPGDALRRTVEGGRQTAARHLAPSCTASRGRG